MTHPVFPKILLHSDAELAEALGAGIVARETIHEWPLSCVQKLVLEDGRKLAYKSQLPPTVEAPFYERASSRLLPHHLALGKVGACDTLLLDWIDAPQLCDLAPGETELVEYGRQLVRQIGEIGGDLPAYLDVGSPEKWLAEERVTLEKLSRLLADGRFRRPAPNAVERVRTWAASALVLGAIAEGPRVTHGDLKADQVFVEAAGYRIVDWQRPVLAPPELDLVALLVDQQVNPAPYAAKPIVGIYWFLRLRWAVEAQHDLFPERRWPLFDRWAAEAVGKILEM